MGFIYSIVNSIIEGISNFGIALLSILPDSPLKIDSIPLDGNLLAYINWLVPINRFIQIGGAWLTCITIWYAVQVGLRWTKAIE